MMASGNRRELGDKLAPRLAKLVAETTIAARAKLAPHEAKVHQAATQALIDRAGHEIADLYRPLVQEALNSGKLHPKVHEFLAKAASGQHQWQAIAGFTLSSTGAASTLGTVINNELAPIVYSLVATNPHLIPDAGTIAGMVTRGHMPVSEGTLHLAELGFNEGWATRLYQMALSWPDITTIVELVRRREIDNPTAHYLLTNIGIPESAQDWILSLVGTPLPPEILAELVVKGIRTERDGAREAYESGTSAEQFHEMYLNTGEPPSLTDLSLAFRRGFIDQATFVHGIKQSRVRDEWIPTLEKIQYMPMSVADAITAYVQGHIDLAEVHDVAKVNGLEDKYVATLIESAGEPISKLEAIELMRRGAIDQATAVQAIRESRIKDKYIPSILQLAVNIPPAREITTLYSHGGITEAKAKELLAMQGYDQELQDAFVTSSVHGKTATLKQLTLGEASRLYIEHVISWGEVEKLLKPIGYGPTDLKYVKDILDNQRLYRNREAAITKIRSLYISYHIDQSQASSQLDALQVKSDERDKLIQLWGVARESNARQLTPAEIVDAYGYDIIGPEEALTRLQSQGYSRIDAVIRLEIKKKGIVPGLAQ